MRTLAPRRVISAVSIALAAAAGVVAAPSPALAAPLVGVGDQAVTTCDVTAGDISWGFKESFRSYISGSIARGEWTTTDGASYATPAFGFTGAGGTYDPQTATGTASFPGTITFTGHDGLLRTSVSNPTISFTGPGAAQLLLDVSTVPMEQAMAGDDTVHTVTQIPFATIDLSGATVTDEGVTAVEAPTAVTAEGFAAFGNYDAGTPFDPMTISVGTTCAAPEPEPTVTETPELITAPEETVLTDPNMDVDPGATAFLPIAGGIAAVVVIAGAAVLIIRRKRQTTSADA